MTFCKAAFAQCLCARGPRRPRARAGTWPTSKLYFFATAILALAPTAAAQFIGYNAAQSTQQTLFINQATNATSPTITNLGQSSHFVTVCNTSFTGTILLESSRDGTFNPPATVAAANYGLTTSAGGNLTSDTGCHLIQAGGYFPALRVRITNASNTAGAGTTISYAGIGGPVAPDPAALSTAGPTSPTACDSNVGNFALNSDVTNAQLVPGLPGSIIIVCTITLSFPGATTAGEIAFSGTTDPSTCVVGAAAQLHHAKIPLPIAFPTPRAILPLYTLFVTPQTPQIVHLVGGPGGLFRIQNGQSWCMTTASVGVQTMIDATFAQVAQ
jgi:hypothetical protein